MNRLPSNLEKAPAEHPRTMALSVTDVSAFLPDAAFASTFCGGGLPEEAGGRASERKSKQQKHHNAKCTLRTLATDPLTRTSCQIQTAWRTTPSYTPAREFTRPLAITLPHLHPYILSTHKALR